MKACWLALVALCLAPPLRADGPKEVIKPAGAKAPGKVYQVPYRLTDTNHIMVRVKINGKGPFNLIVDTGAPMLFLAVPAAEKAGLKVKKKGGDVVKLDRLEVEGGVTLPGVKCMVETPFQLKGMNAFGMAGEELHGMLGYTVLAHFKMEIDSTRPKMTWTRLNYKPAQPVRLNVKGKDANQESMENLGGFMQAMALMMGKKKQEPLPRGFLGVELAEKDGAVTVTRVLKSTPAADAGLRKGDRITEVQGKEVATPADVLRRAATVTAGETVRLTVVRGADKKEITVTAGEGL